MIEHFRTLFEYDDWANRRIFKSWENSPASSITPRALKWFSHLLTAHELWYLRMIKQNTQGITFWPEYSVDECGLKVGKIAENWRNFLSDISNEKLEELCHHQNSSGQWFDLPFKDTLTHVINHATYHRGQIVADLRKNGGNPLATDFVVFRRIVTGQIK